MDVIMAAVSYSEERSLLAEKDLKTQRAQRTAAEDAEKVSRWRSDFSRLRRDRRHTRFLDWETSILYMSPPLPRYASSIEAACELNKNSSLSMFQLTDRIIGAAIKVHSRLGPGLLESAYESCVAYELDSHGIRVIRQKAVPLIYERVKLDCGFRADLVVDNRVVVELKCKEQLHPVDEVQLLSHLRLLNLQVGLLINFHVVHLRDGIRRIVNNYQERGIEQDL